MKEDFRRAKRTLGTNRGKMSVVAVNGCCYGKDDNPDKGEYLTYCGQRFWEFISGDVQLYEELVEPLGQQAKQRNAAFLSEYSRVINKFSLQFGKDYCAKDGSIAWKKLVRFNSGS